MLNRIPYCLDNTVRKQKYILAITQLSPLISILDSAKLQEVTAQDTVAEIWEVSSYILSLALPAWELSAH